MCWRPSVRIATRSGEVVYSPRGRGIPKELADANYRVCQLLEMSWMSLLSDSPLDPIKPREVVTRFYHRIEEDLLGTIRAYSIMAQALLRSVTVVGNSINIEFVSDLKRTPVFREYLHFIHTHDVRCFRFVYSFLVFASKLDVDDPELEASALRGWFEVEARLAALTPTEDVVSPLREIISGILEYWDEADFLPVHGSGAVAERGVRTVEEKCAYMAFPRHYAYMYNQHDGSCMLPSEGPQRHLPKRVSRLMFVKKSYKSKRSICMEPASLQWAQQGVRLWTEEAVRGWLAGFVNLADQRINQSAAEWGSITQLCDTIDLSSASDSVLWLLVRAIFPGRILRHLIATRSTHVELPGGELVKLHKFAPMGSSLCFPIQTIIYASVVVLASVYTHLGSKNHETVCEWLKTNDWKQLFAHNLTTTAHRFQPFRCFGDDIVTDRATTSNVIDLLMLLGFKVNAEKSFTGDLAFRESCGGHYLLGHDVTPFYFRIEAFGKRVSQKSYVSAIESANRAYEFGYLHVRSVLINFVKHYPIEGIFGEEGVNPILFSSDSDDSFAIFTENPRNGHLIQRKAGSSGTAQAYQRDEYQSLGLRTKAESGVVAFDNYHYTAWCRSRYRSHTEQPWYEVLYGPRAVAAKAGAVSTVWYWRWTPVS